MKKILLSLLLIGFILSNVNAQKKVDAINVPKPVLIDFNTKFPSATKVKWRQVDVLYEAEISQNGKDVYITYKDDGTLVETISEILVKEVPAEVVKGIQKLFPDAEIKSAAKIDQANKSSLYETEIKYKGKKAVATWDSKGNQVD